MASVRRVRGGPLRASPGGSRSSRPTNVGSPSSPIGWWSSRLRASGGSGSRPATSTRPSPTGPTSTGSWPMRPAPSTTFRAGPAVDQQWELLESLGPLYRSHPFSDGGTDGQRYRFLNEAYGHGDGLTLHAMLRHLRPARIVEVGSGWSSACMLDTADGFLDPAPKVTFVEPYPTKLLRSRLLPGRPRPGGDRPSTGAGHRVRPLRRPRLGGSAVYRLDPRLQGRERCEPPLLPGSASPPTRGRRPHPRRVPRLRRTCRSGTASAGSGPSRTCCGASSSSTRRSRSCCGSPCCSPSTHPACGRWPRRSSATGAARSGCGGAESEPRPRRTGRT